MYATPLGNCDENKYLSVRLARKHLRKYIGAQQESSDFINYECTLRH